MDSINAAIKRDLDNIESLTTRVDILARQARIGDAIESTNGIGGSDNAGLLAMRAACCCTPANPTRPGTT